MAFEWKGEVAQDQEVLGNRSCFQSHFRGVTCLRWTGEQNFSSMQVRFGLVPVSSFDSNCSARPRQLCFTGWLRAL